jgi:hypothetical protein
MYMPIRLIALTALLFTAAIPADAEPTRVTVRARALDAKFIGTSVGGLRAVFRDAATGAVLDQGLIRGGTGDTRLLMFQPHERGTTLSDDQTAGYAATLDLAEPTRVRIDLYGPRAAGEPHLASQLLTVLPGHDITGDGIVISVPGLLVTVLSPAPNEVFPQGEAIRIDAHVAMLCGCPIAPDKPWKPEQYDVRATVTDENGKQVAAFKLEYAGIDSIFTGELAAPAAGSYQVTIAAVQDGTPNAGVGVSGLTVK